MQQKIIADFEAGKVASDAKQAELKKEVAVMFLKKSSWISSCLEPCQPASLVQPLMSLDAHPDHPATLHAQAQRMADHRSRTGVPSPYHDGASGWLMRYRVFW